MKATVIDAVSGDCPSMFGATVAVRTSIMEYLIYIGAILFITAVAALWIATTRQPLQHSHRRHRQRHSLRRWFGGWFGKADDRESSGKKGRRRRSHRKRNPTLAETGGLPPVRSAPASSTDHPEL
jgi:hypothetical protein